MQHFYMPHGSVCAALRDFCEQYNYTEWLQRLQTSKGDEELARMFIGIPPMASTQLCDITQGLSVEQLCSPWAGVLEKHGFASVSILQGDKFSGIQDIQARRNASHRKISTASTFFLNSQDKWVFPYKTKGSIIFQILCSFPRAKKIGHAPGQLIQPQKSFWP